MNAPIQKIVIVGGGVTGWTAAAGLANSFRGQNISIVLLDIPLDEAVACPQTTIPQTLAFHSHLGLDEREILREASGTFRLGTEFCNWPGPGRTQLRPFGSAGANIGFIAFHHYVTKQRLLGSDIDLNDYSISAAAARLGNFSHTDDNSRSLLARLAYGLNLDPAGYTSVLRYYAEQLGVKTLDGVIDNIPLRGDNGFIDALTLSGGQKIDGDLFIDCSGAQGLLIAGALQSGYEDWSQWLPCNQAVGFANKATGSIPATLSCTASDAGWIVQTPLQSKNCHQYIFSSQHLDAGQALDTLREKFDIQDNPEPWHYKISNGHRKKFWIRNCIALGAAAGTFEPLEITGLHLVQSALTRLLAMLPDAVCHPSIAAEYNRVTQQEYQHIRDFLAFNYVAASGQQSPFWKDRQSVAAPDSLQHRLQLFESHGRLPKFEHETFPSDGWASLFISGGYWPQDYDPLLDMVDQGVTVQHFDKMLAAISDTAQRLPSHREYLESFCQPDG